MTVDPQVRDQLVAQTGGNPLALTELPSLLTAGQLSGAEAAALDAAEEAKLVRVQGGSLDFHHPLVRSAVYQAATTSQRRQAHRALAAALHRQGDADRRAWHLAATAVEPDQQVMGELDAVAERARGRGGFEAACAALERAAGLCADPVARGRLLLAAAENAWLAGQLDRTAGLLQAAWLERDRAAGVGLVRVAASLGPAGDPRDRYFADLVAAFLHALDGDLAAAVPLLTRAIGLARRLETLTCWRSRPTTPSTSAMTPPPTSSTCGWWRWRGRAARPPSCCSPCPGWPRPSCSVAAGPPGPPAPPKPSGSPPGPASLRCRPSRWPG